MTSWRSLVETSCLWVFMLSGLTGLAKSDAPPACEVFTGLDLALLADVSGSVGNQSFTMLKNLLKNIVIDATVSEDNTRIGLIVFHKNPKVLTNFASDQSSNEEDLLNLIENMSPKLGRYTFIDRALIAAEEQLFSAVGGDRHNVPDVLVLLTDGKTNANSQAYEEIIPRLQAKAVHIVAFGIGPQVRPHELRRIAGEHVILEEQFSQLSKRIKDLEEMACAIDGGYTEWSCWTACSKVCGGGKKTRTRTCTNPPPKGIGKDCSELGGDEMSEACNDFTCELECQQTSGMDLALLLDTTASVGEKNFKLLKDFLKLMVNELPIAANRTRVGLMTYHKNANVLNNFADQRATNKEELLNLIDNIPDTLGSVTFIDRALIAANEQLFSKAGGDRDEVPNALILFSDGKTSAQSTSYAEIVPKLQVKGVKITAIGIGRGTRGYYRSELEKIAGENNVLMVDHFDQLISELGELEMMVCGFRENDE